MEVGEWRASVVDFPWFSVYGEFNVHLVRKIGVIVMLYFFFFISILFLYMKRVLAKGQQKYVKNISFIARSCKEDYVCLIYI